MDGEVKVAINYDRIADDSKWDGLKGYLTNTDIPIQDVYGGCKLNCVSKEKK